MCWLYQCLMLVPIAPNFMVAILFFTPRLFLKWCYDHLRMSHPLLGKDTDVIVRSFVGRNRDTKNSFVFSKFSSKVTSDHNVFKVPKAHHLSLASFLFLDVIVFLKCRRRRLLLLVKMTQPFSNSLISTFKSVSNRTRLNLLDPSSKVGN